MFKKPPLAGPENDMAALTRRQTSLTARVASAKAASVAAVAARRLLLTENDDPTPAALADADRACRTAADAEGAAADALSEIESRIIDTRGRIDRTRVAEGREREAAALEAAAAKADAAIARIVKAAAEIDRARADLADAIPAEAVALYFPPSNAVEFGPKYLTAVHGYNFEGVPVADTLTAELLASRVAGHFLASTLPSLGIAKLEDTLRRCVDGQTTRILGPVDADAAASLLTNPMRQAAAARRLPEAA